MLGLSCGVYVTGRLPPGFPLGVPRGGVDYSPPVPEPQTAELANRPNSPKCQDINKSSKFSLYGVPTIVGTQKHQNFQLIFQS